MDNTNITTHSWRDKRYRRFYEVVDSIIDELQDARPEKGGKAVKRKSRGARFESLTYSVEKIIRDCVAVVFQRKRIQAASITKSYSHYPADRDDKKTFIQDYRETGIRGRDCFRLSQRSKKRVL